MNKETLLNSFAQRLVQAASAGRLDRRPLTIHQVYTVAGPRAGALEIHAGLDNGCIPALIYEVTGRYPCANWDCPCFEPTTGMKGKHPDGLPDPF